MAFSSPAFINVFARFTVCVVALLSCALLGPTSAYAAYEGPAPAPNDKYGTKGPYSVVVESVVSPAWPERKVSVYLPQGAAGARPTWFFAHGFAGNNPEIYAELLMHLASHGAVVVFSPYPTERPSEDLYRITYEGFEAASAKYSDRMDLTRVGFIGHSLGGGAVPWLAVRGAREHGWGSKALALFSLAPWFSLQVSDADFASLPAHTKAVIQVYEDDVMNDHCMAVDMFTRIPVPAEEKDFLIVRSDRVNGYNYAADHRVPTGAFRPDSEVGVFNALDAWAVHRIGQALGAAAFENSAEGRAIALGNGSVEQTFIGEVPGERALRAMTQTDTPVPLYPESRYRYGFSHPSNSRRGAALPPNSVGPRMVNMSARAWAGTGDETLIVGANVAGERAKSLLIRAIGPALRNQGVTARMPNPLLQVFRRSSADLQVDDWGQAMSLEPLVATAQAVGAFPLLEGSRDAAVLAAFSPGTLTVHAVPADGTPGVALLELYDAEIDGGAQLSNLSARSRVGPGEDVLIAGFYVTGPGSLNVLVRGIGPGLSALGVGNALEDPLLDVFRGAERIGGNDNWSSDPVLAAQLAETAARVGGFPLEPGSMDACVLLSLSPGAYTAHVNTKSGRTGTGLVEVYVVY